MATQNVHCTTHSITHFLLFSKKRPALFNFVVEIIQFTRQQGQTLTLLIDRHLMIGNSIVAAAAAAAICK